MTSKAKGSLLVMAECLETAEISEQDRDRIVLGFYDMKSAAERQHDRFYALEVVYSHHYSYGFFYPGFVNMSWKEFQACDTLKGISETTFEMMQSFCQHPDIKTVSDKAEFLEQVEPHAYSGYFNPMDEIDFVNNMISWEKWHRRWYADHQEKINWNEVDNDWLPRLDLVNEIMRRELIIVLGRKKADLIPDDRIVTEFYAKVMRRQGDNIEAFASRIGNEVCLSNYYLPEQVLSTMEQQYVGSFRKIYSIINRHGQRQFISIDFRHGMFEFHNERGEHLGEYHFDGSFNAEADLGHSLKCLDQWRRKTGK